MVQSAMWSTAITVVGLILLCAIPPDSRAAVVVVAVESGGDIVLTTQAGGSLNLTGMSFDQAMVGSARIEPAGGFFMVGNLESADQYSSPPISSVPFGSGPLAFATFGTGDIFGIAGGATGSIFVPSGYIPGAPLNGTATYVGETFASRGLTPGTYVWSLPSDTITLRVVPIPAAAWLFVSAIGWLGWARRKKDLGRP